MCPSDPHEVSDDHRIASDLIGPGSDPKTRSFGSELKVFQKDFGKHGGTKA